MDLDQVRKNLSAPDLNARLGAVDALSNWHGPESQREPLCQLVRAALLDPDPLVRANATDVVFELRLVEVAPALATILGADDDALVRASAAEALGELNVPAVLPALTAALNDEDESVRTFAANSFGLVAETTDGSILRDALEAEKAPSVRLNLVVASARLGSGVGADDITREIRASTAEEIDRIRMVNTVADLVARPRKARIAALGSPLLDALAHACSAAKPAERAELDGLIAKIDAAISAAAQAAT